MTLSTKCPSQGESDIYWGFTEVGDPGSGRSGDVDLGQSSAPSHHWREDDDCRECVGWDLLWLGPDDVGVAETTVVVM